MDSVHKSLSDCIQAMNDLMDKTISSHLQSLYGSLQKSLDKTIKSSLHAMKAEMAQQFDTFVQSYTPESEQCDESSIHVLTGQQPLNSFWESPMSINPHGHLIVSPPGFSFTIPLPQIQVPLGSGGHCLNFNPQTREPLWHLCGPSHDVHSQSQERFSCLSEGEILMVHVDHGWSKNLHNLGQVIWSLTVLIIHIGPVRQSLNTWTILSPVTLCHKCLTTNLQMVLNFGLRCLTISNNIQGHLLVSRTIPIQVPILITIF